MFLQLASTISAGHRVPVTGRNGDRGGSGFTLVELLVVIAIIATLTTLGVFGMKSAMTAARQAAKLEICPGALRPRLIVCLSKA